MSDATGISIKTGGDVGKALNNAGDWAWDHRTEILTAAAVIAGGYYAMPYLTSATWGTITPGAVGWGAATGGAVGGYSASVQGGNVLQGVVFGAVMGAGAGALVSALPVIGATTAGELSLWGSIGQGAVFGTIQGAAFGAAIGYGGGVGNMDTILRGAAYGAATGAATGAVLGGIKYAYNGQLYGKADKFDAKNFSGKASDPNILDGTTSVPNSGGARSAGLGDLISAIGKGFNAGTSNTANGTLFNVNIFGSMYQGGATLAGADAYLYNQYMQQQLEVKHSINY